MILLLGIVVLSVIIMGIILIKKKGKSINNYEKKVRKVDCVYKSDSGNFEAKGNLEKFIVNKDGRYEFLVENGVIIACKDKEHHENFIYYGGEDNV